LDGIISELVNDNNLQITEISWNNQNTEFVVIDVEQPYEPESIDQTAQNNSTQNNNTNSQSVSANTSNTNTQNNNTQNSNTQKSNTKNSTNNTPVNQKPWDCWEWLSVQDCEELNKIFWNININ